MAKVETKITKQKITRVVEEEFVEVILHLSPIEAVLLTSLVGNTVEEHEFQSNDNDLNHDIKKALSDVYLAFREKGFEDGYNPVRGMDESALDIRVNHSNVEKSLKCFADKAKLKKMVSKLKAGK